MNAAPDLSEQENKLLELTYSATADPSLFHELLERWEVYLQTLDERNLRGGDFDFEKHFNLAFEVLTRIGRPAKQAMALEEMLRTINLPAVIVDQALNAIFATANMHLLDLIGPDLTKAAIAKVQSGSRFELIPLFDAEGFLESVAIVTKASDDGPGNIGRFVIALSSGGVDDTILSSVKDRFGLTDAEAEVLDLLLQGNSVSAISDHRHVSEATTRSQVRRLLEKTHTNNMTQMITKVMNLTAPINGLEVSKKLLGRTSGSDHQISKIITAEGRVLAYRQFGDLNGRPILMWHNMMGGPYWLNALEKVCAQNGWRIIAPSRPGFGESDSVAAEGLKLVQQTGSDGRFLLDHLGVARALVFGVTSSAGLAAQFAVDHADRTRAVFTVGHAGLMDREMIAAMKNPARATALTYLRSPTALRYLIRVAVASIDILGPEKMMRRYFKGSAADLALLEDEGVMSAMCRGLNHAMAQGGEAFSRDCFVALTDWSETWARVNCATTCILGAEDPVYPIGHAKRLTSNLPNIRLIVVPNAGQYVHYAGMDRFMSALEETWNARPSLHA